MVFVVKLAAVELVGGEVLGGEDGGLAGEAVSGGVLGRTLFARSGTRSSGQEGVRLVGAVAVEVGEIARHGVRARSVGSLGVRDWVCHCRVCHEKASDLVVAWAGGDAGRRVVDVVGWEGKHWWGSGVNAETHFCNSAPSRSVPALMCAPMELRTAQTRYCSSVETGFCDIREPDSQGFARCLKTYRL